MAKLAHYSPEDVTIIFAGVYELSGYADGTFISISKEENSFTTNVTADGMVTRSRSPNGLYTVELTLHNASSSNDVLSYALLLDETTKMGKFPLIVKDQLGTSLLFSTTSWVETRPNAGFSTDVEGRPWSIKCSQAVHHIGGNYRDSEITQDIFNASVGLAGGFVQGVI